MKRLEEMPVSILTEIYRIKRDLRVEDVYLVGGCLQHRYTQDYDILITVTEENYNDNLQLFLDGLIEYYDAETFDGYVTDIKGLGNYDSVIKLTPLTDAFEKIDILVIFIAEDEPVFDLVDFITRFFPLDIQRQFLLVSTRNTFPVDLSTIDQGTIRVKHPYKDGCKVVNKYRGYYPEADFIFEEPPGVSFPVSF